MIGTSLSHYKILAKIGAGGMGEVYRAEDTHLGRQVAVKILPRDLATDPARLERFRREARALATLDHPNIVTIHSVEEAGGVHFLTMGLVEGRTLDKLIPAAGLPLEQFFDIALPLTEAVAAAHDRGVIHRDLKPANVMVAGDGRLKVLDFGLAKVGEHRTDEDPTRVLVTRDGTVVGTAPYMSPEQIEGTPVDSRSDIFSLGIVLYELATGRRPFSGDSTAGLMSSILRDVPPSVDELRADLPRHLGRVVGRCLEKQPRSRYQTVRDVANELAALRREVESSESRTRPPAAPEPEGVGIAVLPFVDLSPSRDQDYFCEGMAEEIMNSLVQIAGIRVASRTSAFRVKQDGKDPATIGRLLSVAQILDGSVRVAGDRMRVTARLVDVETDFQIWSARYDRDAEDVFAVQDEIAAGVVQAVRERLAPEAGAVRSRSQVRNLDAYRHYLKGRHFRYTRNDYGNAVQSYRQAVALDPGHGPSWVGLAETGVLTALYGLTPARPAYAKARQALARATSLQGESAEGLYVTGMIAFAERDWPLCEESLLRAVGLKPDFVQASCWLGVYYAALRRLDEAMPVWEGAMESDPVASYPYAMTGAGLQILGRPSESMPYLEQAIEFEKENTLAQWTWGVALLVAGRHQESIDMLGRAVLQSHRGPYFLGLLGWAQAVAGRHDEARAVLEELRARPDPAPAVVSEAWLLAALGELEATWEVLERARDEHQGFVVFTELPGTAPLYRDPRFGSFVNSLGLPPGPLSSLAQAGDAS